MTSSISIKALLIILSLGLSYGTVAERVGSLGGSSGFLLYASLFAFLSVCLLLAAQVANGPLRVTYALLLSASAFFLESSERIMGEHLSYDAFINLLNSFGFADEALTQHRSEFLRASLGALPLFAGIALQPRKEHSFVPVAGLVAPVGGILCLAGILFVRGGDGGRGLPRSFTPLAYSTLYLYEAAIGAAGARKDVSLPRPAVLPRRDIVLIVDESVVGTFLDLNSAQGVRSGLQEQRPGAKIINYGRAASITNCSVGTNVTLRFGGTRTDYQRINATMPSIWAYARKAGLATVYIDAQRTGGQLHNLMSSEEVEEIDRLIQFDNLPVRHRDLAAADQLAALLNNDKAEFVLVNKVGAHFPVHDKYPDAYMRYQPALPRGEHGEVSDSGSRDGFSGGDQDWIRYRNAYRNTLLWNVGAFFDRLFARADLGRATLVYTSDHGQDLHQQGREGVNTHCSSNPVREEGLVPLVIIEGARLRTLDWQRHHRVNVDRASHYQLFPTLLELMGYRAEAVRGLYGDSLVPRSKDPGTFNTRFNARLGQKPTWVSIRA